MTGPDEEALAKLDSPTRVYVRAIFEADRAYRREVEMAKKVRQQAIDDAARACELAIAALNDFGSPTPVARETEKDT